MFKSKRQKKISYAVFSVYLLLLVWLVLFKMTTDFTNLSHMRSINLIPFGSSAIINGSVSLREILYNILVFIPFGVYVEIFKPEIGIIRKFLPAFFLSIFFEFVQYIFAIGASDVTDVINNTIGGVLGVLLGLFLNKMFGVNKNTIANTICITVESCVVILFIILTFANT